MLLYRQDRSPLNSNKRIRGVVLLAVHWNFKSHTLNPSGNPMVNILITLNNIAVLGEYNFDAILRQRSSNGLYQLCRYSEIRGRYQWISKQVPVNDSSTVSVVFLMITMRSISLE